MQYRLSTVNMILRHCCCRHLGRVVAHCKRSWRYLGVFHFRLWSANLRRIVSSLAGLRWIPIVCLAVCVAVANRSSMCWRRMCLSWRCVATLGRPLYERSDMLFVAWQRLRKRWIVRILQLNASATTCGLCPAWSRPMACCTGVIRGTSLWLELITKPIWFFLIFQIRWLCTSKPCFTLFLLCFRRCTNWDVQCIVIDVISKCNQP